MYLYKSSVGCPLFVEMWEIYKKNRAACGREKAPDCVRCWRIAPWAGVLLRPSFGLA